MAVELYSCIVYHPSPVLWLSCVHIQERLVNWVRNYLVYIPSICNAIISLLCLYLVHLHTLSTYLTNTQCWNTFQWNNVNTLYLINSSKMFQLQDLLNAPITPWYFQSVFCDLITSPGGPAFLARTKQKVSNIVGLTALQLAFLWDISNTKWCNGFYIEFRQCFAKETFSYDEY